MSGHFCSSNVSRDATREKPSANRRALRLFRPIQISTLGTFQDGGLKHNNPIHLALWESRQIWPSIKQPDVVVSLGTGTTVNGNALPPTDSNFRHVINDGFVPRLWRSFMSSLDGQSTWRDLWNRLDNTAKDSYFRANVYLSNDALGIDKIEHMDQLRDSVHVQPHNHRFRDRAAFALLAASFFFELTSPPLFLNTKHYCRGVIRCRLNGNAICPTLNRVHSLDLEFLAENEVIGYYKGSEDVCPRCHRYQKEVEFAIRHLDDPVTISLQSALYGRRNVSGFPESIQWFKDQLHMDAHFGRPFHTSARACEDCTPQPLHRYSLLPKRKGGEHYSQGAPALKRPRF